MVAVTVEAAKNRLEELVSRAMEGERVVLLKGSRKVVSLNPLLDDEPPLAITDAQAKRLIERMERQRAEGRTKAFPSAEEGVACLRRKFRLTASRARRRPR